MGQWKKEMPDVEGRAKKDGSRTYRVRFRKGGKTFYRGGIGTAADAKDIAAHLRSRAVRSASGLADNDALLQDVYEPWLAHLKLHRRPSTVANYEHVMAHVRRFWRFDLVRVSSIRPTDWDRFVTQMRTKKYSDATINGCLRRVKGMLNWGVRQGELVSNPLSHVPMLTDRTRKEQRALTDREIWLLLNADTGKPWAFRDAALLYLNSGLRRDELANLLWTDLSLQAAQLTVQAHGEWTPKTPASAATLPLPDVAVQMLARRHLRTTHQPEDHVFPEAQWNQLRALRARIKAINAIATCDDERIAGYVGIHTLRYTYGDRLYRAAVDLKTIQALMRHKNIGVTMNLYLRDSHQKQAGVALLQPPQPPQRRAAV